MAHRAMTWCYPSVGVGFVVTPRSQCREGFGFGRQGRALSVGQGDEMARVGGSGSGG